MDLAFCTGLKSRSGGCKERRCSRSTVKNDAGSLNDYQGSRDASQNSGIGCKNQKYVDGGPQAEKVTISLVSALHVQSSHRDLLVSHFARDDWSFLTDHSLCVAHAFGLAALTLRLCASVCIFALAILRATSRRAVYEMQQTARL